MKPESENPEPLGKLMREWRVTEPLPPRFQEGVWQKIQQAESSANPMTTTLWSAFAAWLSSVLPRPAFATAYVMALLCVGAGTGIWQARSQSTRSHDELGTRYVQTVDPYQKPRL